MISSAFDCFWMRGSSEGAQKGAWKAVLLLFLLIFACPVEATASSDLGDAVPADMGNSSSTESLAVKKEEQVQEKESKSGEEIPSGKEGDLTVTPSDTGESTESVDGSTNSPETVEPTDPTDDASVAEGSDQPTPAPTPSEKEKEALKVRYYQVRTQVEKEQPLVEFRHEAEQESTDEGKRERLRSYYHLLFQRMVEVDSSLKEHCDVMQAAYMRRLDQRDVEPTVPLPNQTSPTDLVPGQGGATSALSASKK